MVHVRLESRYRWAQSNRSAVAPRSRARLPRGSLPVPFATACLDILTRSDLRCGNDSNTYRSGDGNAGDSAHNHFIGFHPGNANRSSARFAARALNKSLPGLSLFLSNANKLAADSDSKTQAASETVRGVIARSATSGRWSRGAGAIKVVAEF
jgi:hypothetical protein